MAVIKKTSKTNKNTDFLVFNKEEICNYLDPNKETIVAFTSKFKNTAYNHVDGYIKEVFEVLETKYNVIYIGYENDHLEHKTLIYVNLSRLKSFVEQYMKRKKDANTEGDQYNNDNHKLLYEYISEKISWIKNIKYITGITTIGEWRLMLQKHTIAGPKRRHMYNEFHDYVGNDPIELKEIKAINADVVKNYKKYANPLAFMQLGAAVFYNALMVLIENNKSTLKSIDGFANDPTFFFPLFDSLPVNNRNFYFVDDQRGIRPYKRFPIAEIQHIVYDTKMLAEANKYDSLFSDDCSKEKNLFIFMGTILNIKGDRSTLWEKYLKNLKLKNSAFYIPPVKQGIIFKPTTEKRIALRQEKFTNKLKDLLEDITSHPLYKGYLFPIDVNKEIDNYKYTFIMRCVSCNDSLNYRPVQYTYHRILFFLDPMYDPEYLQIPKHIQEKLIVHDSTDIENKIQYFEEHPEEREQILDELWKHFEIDKWLESDYSKKVILSYYP